MPLPRLAMNVRTRSAAAGVREIDMRRCPRRGWLEKFYTVDRVVPGQFRTTARIASCNVSNRPNLAGGTSSAPAASCQSQAASWSQSSPANGFRQPRSGGQQVRTAKCLEAGLSHAIALDPERERDLGPLLPVARPAAWRRTARPACRPSPASRAGGAEPRRCTGDRPLTSGMAPERGSPALSLTIFCTDPAAAALDLGRRRETPEAQPQRALRQSIAAPEGAQHIGRLGVQAGAGGAGRHGEVRQRQQQGSRPPRRRP